MHYTQLHAAAHAVRQPLQHASEPVVPGCCSCATVQAHLTAINSVDPPKKGGVQDLGIHYSNCFNPVIALPVSVHCTK